MTTNQGAVGIVEGGGKIEIEIDGAVGVITYCVGYI